MTKVQKFARVEICDWGEEPLNRVVVYPGKRQLAYDDDGGWLQLAGEVKSSTDTR